MTVAQYRYKLKSIAGAAQRRILERQRTKTMRMIQRKGEKNCPPKPFLYKQFDILRTFKKKIRTNIAGWSDNMFKGM